MKRKVMAALLSAVMVMGLAAGCGSGKEGSTADGEKTTELTLLVDCLLYTSRCV